MGPVDYLSDVYPRELEAVWSQPKANTASKELEFFDVRKKIWKMTTFDLTAIVLAMIGMVSGWVTYWLDRRRHKHEVEGLKADNRQKDMNLSMDYVKEWRTYIAEPLQREVGELRNEVTELRHAIQRIGDCAHRADCPVLGELQRKSHSDC